MFCVSSPNVTETWHAKDEPKTWHGTNKNKNSVLGFFGGEIYFVGKEIRMDSGIVRVKEKKKKFI